VERPTSADSGELLGELCRVNLEDDGVVCLGPGSFSVSIGAADEVR